MADPLRPRRWDDFQRRLGFSPTSVYVHRTEGWRYIPIHPFADETEQLVRLGLAPQDCSAADAWWGIEGDATLVQSWIARVANRPQGLYARRTEHVEGHVYLMAVLDIPAITRDSFEAVLTQFASLGFPDAEHFRLVFDARLTRLADVDAH